MKSCKIGNVFCKLTMQYKSSKKGIKLPYNSKELIYSKKVSDIIGFEYHWRRAHGA
ncbi:hypothetical protein PATY110618_06810 [Paenibacillus typhae]|uniref:Uncharacterized protein n=1 Tax=Paenibacillus typhae TaxID=1174501 RepID=A0A1G8FCM1_9BACL|nr:hypothetical protein SAMN05216192_101203 [Paenibacillus typhae]